MILNAAEYVAKCFCTIFDIASSGKDHGVVSGVRLL